MRKSHWQGAYQRKRERRERVIFPGERHLINVLPAAADIPNSRYVQDPELGLVVTDGRTFTLEINEFTSLR